MKNNTIQIRVSILFSIFCFLFLIACDNNIENRPFVSNTIDGVTSIDTGNSTIPTDLVIDKSDKREANANQFMVLLTSEYGELTLDKDFYYEGDTVSYQITPTENYRVKTNTLKQNGVVLSATTDTNTQITKGDFIMPAANVTITAEFERIYKITVNTDNIVANGGSVEVISYAAEGEIVNVIVNVSPDNKGGDQNCTYYLEENSLKYNDNSINDNSFIMPDEDVEIKLTILKKDYLCIYYYAMAPHTSDSYAVCEYYFLNDEVTINDISFLDLPTSETDGYTFIGWAINYYYDRTVAYTAEQVITITENMFLYGVWKEIE